MAGITETASIRLRGPILILFVLSRAPSIPAREAVLDLDPAKTEIGFTLSATLHTVHGKFNLKSGTVHFDPTTGRASGLIVVDATSAETGNRGRDRKMHKEILESAQYPEIAFTPVRVEGRVAATGESQVAVGGLMKLHGTQHEITLQARIRINGDDAKAEVHLVIPYIQWGLKNPSTFLLRVSDKLDMEVRGAGHLTGLSDQR